MSHPNLPPEAEAQIRAALASRKKIQAIKIYRDATGQGLKESKEAVEAMQHAASPVSPSSSSTGKRPGVESRGCGPSAAMLMLAAAVLYICWHALS